MNRQEYLQKIDECITNGKYQDNWESLSGHKTPDWYYQGKLGIFIHWGIYSVPAYGNEWYSRNMYNKESREFQHHIDTYGPQDQFGYKDFIPMFKGERFSADQWTDLFKKAGAKFVMPVAEHHDGFAMYDTEFNKWNAAQMGPCRDYLGEMKKACEDRELTFCASTHRAEHYMFMGLGRTFNSDVNDEKYADFYGPAYYDDTFADKDFTDTTYDIHAKGPDQEFLEDWMVRTCEIIDKYQPKILYFDWWIHNEVFKPYLKKIAAYYYNRAEEWGVETTINYKHEAFAPTVATFDVERGGLEDISPVPWQTDTAIGKRSWGYTTDNEFKTARQVVRDFVDIVSKNGMLMINVGPRSDGTITDEETKVLTDIGAWMDINSEGIYGTSPWKQFGEGGVNVNGGYFSDNDEKPFTAKDFRFTYKAGKIYAFWMAPDQTADHVDIESLKVLRQDYIVKNVRVLGSEQSLDYKRDADKMTIDLAKAAENIKTDMPVCFEISID